jgi:UAA transporter family
VTIAGALNGELDEGCLWLSQPGTYKEFTDNDPIHDRTWSVGGKIAVLFVFSATGFFALSCCQAITKNFGALTMSVTSTARKATTIFISFALFDNVITPGHMVGIVIFISALIVKVSLRRDAEIRRQLKRKTSGADLSLVAINSTNRGGNRIPKTNGGYNPNSNGGAGGTEQEHLTLRHGSSFVN